MQKCQQNDRFSKSKDRFSKSKDTTMAHVVSLDDINDARATIMPFGVRETPIHTSSTMDALSGHQLFFKCELFQTTGSFKVGRRDDLTKIYMRIKEAYDEGSRRDQRLREDAGRPTSRHAFQRKPRAGHSVRR